MNSMTGFGRAVAQTDRYNILVEISGVNRKQTEIAVNVPRSRFHGPPSRRVQGDVEMLRPDSPYSSGAWTISFSYSLQFPIQL